MTRIFISYRRSISRYAAAMLHQFCVNRFGRQYLFFDTETIRPGDSFPSRILRALSTCEVLLPLIGPNWHKVADENGLRLQQPEDWVRREIATVLRRNRETPAGSAKPVLVIPLIEAEASVPRADDLPDELKALQELNSVNYHNPRDLDVIASAINDRLGPPPMGEFGMRVLAQRPDRSRRNQYRFRRVRNPADLDPFVTFSDAEVVIAGANPELSGEKRRELYDKWCQWTARDEWLSWHDPANAVPSFVLLDQKQPDGTWFPIGVSILLPLSVNGSRHLRLIRKSDHVLAAKRNAATLEGDDLARGSSDRLLLDTWIIRQRDPVPGKPMRRFEHHHWGVDLLLRHIADLWNPDSSSPVTFLCEPDNPTIVQMLNDLRFSEENRNIASGNLFVLKYPLDEDKYGPEDQDGIDRIIGNIRALREIPIE